MSLQRFDQLVGDLRRTLGELPDKRTGSNTQYSMEDLGLGAFSVLFRDLLDPVEPHHLFSVYDRVYRAFTEQGILEGFRGVHHTRPIALDGTWYSSQSTNIHCPNCSHLEHANGELTHYHSAITSSTTSDTASSICPPCW